MQIFLVVNVFLVGVGITYALYHFSVNIRPAKKEQDPENVIKLSAKARQRLTQQAEESYREILNVTSSRLITELTGTASKLNREMDTSGEKIINEEMERFKQQLEEIHSATKITNETVVKEMVAYQNQLKERMQAEIEAEKARLTAQIDTKLADSVLAFLIDTLQHDIDLGAQTKYITETLEEHKAEFIGKVNDES